MSRRDQIIKFRIFDRENPQVYSLFVRFTMEAINSGRSRFGARMIWERMRWYTMIEAKDHASEFKLNDHYPPYYARKFMRLNPRWNTFFEVRGVDPVEPPKQEALPF